MHLLAEVTEGPDGLRAVCNYREGACVQMPVLCSISCGCHADSICELCSLIQQWQEWSSLVL